jgi:23S rRNA pseudouridine1911/1915/1917 synthase
MTNHQSIIAKPDPASGAPAAPASLAEMGPSDTSANLFELSASGAAGERLDRFLAQQLPQFSRSRLQRWIELGAVSWDERVLSRRHRLIGVETLLVEAQALEAEAAFAPEDVEFDVVHEDRDLLVIDKRAGLVVHPGSGNWSGTLLNGLLHRFKTQAVLPRAGIVHRLDKDTSGLMVVARSEGAMAGLADQLAHRTMGRRYLALVQGMVADRAEVDEPIGRDPSQRIRMAVVHGQSGRPARTAFRRLAQGRLDGRVVSLIECRLHTGRTHQIRVHLRHAGAPIVGDELYGGWGHPLAPRQALHAWRLELSHPQDGRRRVWTSLWPKDCRALLQAAEIDLDDAMLGATQSFNDPGAV